MSLLTVLGIVGVGLAVGLLSGLVGIGGGVLIVPFLYFFYDHPGLFGVEVPGEMRAALAHGTSLFVIVPTSLRGALAYQRTGMVEWRAVWPIGMASLVSAVAGARLAVALPPEVLKLLFGLLLVVAGARLGTGRATGTAAPPEPRLSPAITVGGGLLVGLFSALLGVGGGIVAIPILVYLVRLDIRKVSATSMGIIAITAAAGTASYMVGGLGVAGLPAWSIGYVHLSAGLAMFAGSVLSVRWGADLNQKLKPGTLALVFAVLFVLLGLRLIVENGGAVVGGG